MTSPCFCMDRVHRIDVEESLLLVCEKELSIPWTLPLV